MCKMTMREQNRERMRTVVTNIQKHGWEVVLMTEITSLEEEGVIWMGEAAKLIFIINSKHSAILLRGRALNEWLEGGQKKWMTKRTTAAKVGEICLASVYQPHSGHNAEEIEEYRGEIEEHIERSGPEEVLVVGGDHNAHVGRGEERGPICRKIWEGATRNRSGDAGDERPEDGRECPRSQHHGKWNAGGGVNRGRLKWGEGQLNGGGWSEDILHKASRPSNWKQAWYVPYIRRATGTQEETTEEYAF